MGVTEESELQAPNLTEQFNKAFPYYLSIGMTETEYWDGDNFLPRAFRQADILKMKREHYLAHLYGYHVYEALCEVSPLLHAFAKKGTKPLPYSEYPVPVDDEDREFIENDKRRKAYERVRAAVMDMMKERKNNG